MQCMKCGRDLEAGEVFCVSCREVMEKYPVKPGTVVQLPHRTEQSGPRKPQPRRKTLTLEEQVEVLKNMSRRLALMLALAILVTIGLGYFGVTQYLENRSKQALGQNYSVISTQPPTTETTGTTAEADGAE